MGMKEDIVKILTEYRDRIHDGNSDQAAKSLGIRPPTFWRWLNGKHVPRVETICTAFDMLNARIILPDENEPPQNTRDHELEGLRKDLQYLQKENELLHKLVKKYEADEKKEQTGSREADPAGSTHRVGPGQGNTEQNRMDTPT